MRKEDKFIIAIVILVGLFALYDIGQRAYNWYESASNSQANKKTKTEVIEHNVKSGLKKKVSPIRSEQPGLGEISDIEQAHDLDKFALERVSSDNSSKYEKHTIYSIIGSDGTEVSPIDTAQIKKLWNPPMDRASNVKIIFTAMEDGTIKDIMVASSSGNSVADNAALIAVKGAKSRPFKNPNKHYLDISMWFQVGNFGK